jgi:hypothetical protein
MLRAFLRPEAGGLAVCTALAMVVFAEAWADPVSSPNGDGVGDGALFLWLLRWTPYAIGHGLNPLHGIHLNAPDGPDPWRGAPAAAAGRRPGPPAAQPAPDRGRPGGAGPPPSC